jgi:aminoglycoside phosphotransferase (APT) family kinase protein
VLTHADVPAYLVESGLLDRRAVTAGRVKVRDASRRNHVFIVSGDGTAGYVVKQPDPRDVDLLAREAVVLRQVVAAEPRLAARLPAPVSYDAARRILVCELVGDATDLGAYHARGRFPPLLARRLAEALALLHGLSPCAIDEFPAARNCALLGVPPNPPPFEHLLNSSDEAVRLLRTLQGAPELCERLEELERSWHAGCVVHGDVRPGNCVAFSRPAARRRTRLALVDWEAARGGDPHGDLGIVLGEYLDDWLWSMPVLDGRNLTDAPRHARHSLSAMQPAIRAFWDAYAQARRRDGTGAAPSLSRAVAYAAGHLVGLAFEHAQTQSGPDARTGVALQLSLNLFERPAEAAVRLLGLPAAEAFA